MTGTASPVSKISAPGAAGDRRADWVLVAGYGFVPAAMNSMFYQAIDRVPLGLAVTPEVLGPLVLSVIAARRAASWLWALLALAGVVLLGHSGLHHLDLAGVCFVLGAAVMWGCYILLNARTGQRFPKADGLALAMGFATVLTLPLGLATAEGLAIALIIAASVGAVVFAPARGKGRRRGRTAPRPATR